MADTIDNNGFGDESSLLVIDDDRIQRTIIARIGAQAGFAVTAVGSFEEASAQLQARRFDCVTLDLGLGERSGALILPIVSQLSYRLPVLIISGAEDHLLKAADAMLKSLSIDGETFGKPLDLVRLRQTLSRHCLAVPVARGFRKIA